MIKACRSLFACAFLVAACEAPPDFVEQAGEPVPVSAPPDLLPLDEIAALAQRSRNASPLNNDALEGRVAALRTRADDLSRGEVVDAETKEAMQGALNRRPQ